MDPFTFEFTAVDLISWFDGVVLPPQVPTPGVQDTSGSAPPPIADDTSDDDTADSAGNVTPPAVSADPTPDATEDGDVPQDDSDNTTESDENDTPAVNLQPQVREGADNVNEAQALQAPVNFSQTVGGDDDTYDYFQITAPKSGELVVSLSGMTANLDLRLFDPTGVELVGSENPGTEDDQIVFDAEEGVQYVLQVAPTTDENSPYQVTMTLNGEEGYDGDVPDDDGFVGDDDDQDDGIVDGAVDGAGNVITPGEADDTGATDGAGNVITPGKPDDSGDTGTSSGSDSFDIVAPANFSDTVGGPGEPTDYFQLTAPESGELVVTLSGMTTDLDLGLFDAAGNELVAACTPGTASEQIVFDVTAGSEYVLSISANGSSESDYQVTMTLDGQGGSDGGAVDGSTGDATVTADDTGLVPGGAVPDGAVSGGDGTTVDAAGNVVGGGATDAAGNPVGATPGLPRTASTAYSLAPETTDTDVAVFDSSAFG